MPSGLFRVHNTVPLNMYTFIHATLLVQYVHFEHITPWHGEHTYSSLAWLWVML